jgi:hypothetical protein
MAHRPHPAAVVSATAATAMTADNEDGNYDNDIENCADEGDDKEEYYAAIHYDWLFDCGAGM